VVTLTNNSISINTLFTGAISNTFCDSSCFSNQICLLDCFHGCSYDCPINNEESSYCHSCINCNNNYCNTSSAYNCFCDAGFDPVTNCTNCLVNYNTSETCSICNAGWNISTGCTTCSSGYYGSSCIKCTINCNNGTCNDGIFGNGQCVCNANYNSSTNCSTCTSGWNAETNCATCYSGYYGSSCGQCALNCYGGSCFDGLNGNGTCVCAANEDPNNGCECYSGYYGTTCTSCSAACSGKCADTHAGNGQCIVTSSHSKAHSHASKSAQVSNSIISIATVGIWIYILFM